MDVRDKTEEKSAKVVDVIDDYRVVINAGKNKGVRDTQRFLLYSLGNELTDQDTKESLGRLELVKGTGVIVHVQDRMATLETIGRKSQRHFGGLFSPGVVVEDEKEPFASPEVGDIARSLNP